MPSRARYQAEKAKAAAAGTTPYKARAEAGKAKGLTAGQAVGKPPKGLPSITKLVQQGKLARPARGQLAKAKPYQAKGRGKPPPFKQQTAAGTIVRTRSQRRALAELRRMAAAGGKVSIQWTADTEKGPRNVSTDRGGSRGGGGDLLTDSPLGPITMIHWGKGMAPAGALTAKQILDMWLASDYYPDPDDFWDFIMEEWYDEEYQ